MPEPVNTLLIGGGGREHALARSLRLSSLLGELYTSHPENPGISALAKPVDVPVSLREIYRLQQFCEKKNIGLVVIGPEEPLCEGFADKLATSRTKVFGPSAQAAQIEGDKAWSKKLMRAASIPTAEARLFSDAHGSRRYLESRVADDPVLAQCFADLERVRDPDARRRMFDQRVAENRELKAAVDQPRTDLPVIKAAGLAKGKGVFVPATLGEALAAVDRIMLQREFADAGKTLVIEEKLEGREVSVLAITDGNNILILPPAQDHKRLANGDIGPNTGGMGAFCPADTIDPPTMEIIERDILVPTLDALRREDIPYRGVLYAGLMLTHAGPKVLEFNCRFGDPECQAILPRLRSDLLELMLAACDSTLDHVHVEWDRRASCCVVLASEGYPDKPRLGVPIRGIEDAQSLPDVSVYHAGVKRGPDGVPVTAGGRVLGVTGLGDTLAHARERAYAAVSKIDFAGKTYRTDIGQTS